MNDKIEWVLVPREPTEAMWNAGKHFCDGHVTRTIQTYAAMLASAPKPEAQAAGVTVWLRATDVADLAAEKPWTAGAVGQFKQNRDDEFTIALSTPASHDAQRPSSAMVKVALRNLPQYISKCSLIGPDKHSAMLCFETLRDALVQQPAVVGDGAIGTITRRDSGNEVLEHKIEIDPAFEESLYRHPAGTKVSLYAYPAADVALGNVRAAIAALTPAATPGDGGAQ